jgi:prolyl oligopeptidase
VKGIWRRTTLEEYRKPEPDWECVLDIDALGQAEGKSWVWKGKVLLDEGEGTEKDLCIVQLSDGGADAVCCREFSLKNKQFVEGGFTLPECKSTIAYKDRDTLLVGTEFPGRSDSMTDSGYPRVICEWKRGTELTAAKEVYACKKQHIGAHAWVDQDHGETYEWYYTSLTFYTSEKFLRRHGHGSGEMVKLQVPDDDSPSTFGDQLLLKLRKAWQPAPSCAEFPAGTLLAFKVEEALAGDFASPKVLFQPSETRFLQRSPYTTTKNYVLLHLFDNVIDKVECWRYDATTRSWNNEGELSVGSGGGIAALDPSGVDDSSTDQFWLTTSSYNQPTTLMLADASKGVNAPTEPLKSLPAMYDASKVTVQQFFATSADGTTVPYFQCGPAAIDKPTPTLLYGYGGFEISLTPVYAATVGCAWLEHGNVYVHANIRGGGEFGPAWHQAALREKRNKAYEDFIAVGEDLVRRGVSTSAQLGAPAAFRPMRFTVLLLRGCSAVVWVDPGCQGGSNGGLLVGNMLAMRPDLFGAVVCQVPLLDMARYHKLLAGASWMAEFGDPDTDDWSNFLHKYSPYHNLDPQTVYPPLLMLSSTRDDRVHPGHARKLVKRLMDECPEAKDVVYYENIEGGHGGAADQKQRAFMSTLMWSFLEQRLKVS